MNNRLKQIISPKQLVAGLLVFLLPFLSLVTLWGVSGVSFGIAAVAALIIITGQGRSVMAPHWRAVRPVCLAFLLHFLFTLACLILRSEAILSALERPARMLLAISALMLVLWARPDRRFLWWGVAGGALAGAFLVGYQRLGLDMDRPGGLMNAITFGDMSLCLGLISIAAMIDQRSARQMIWPIIGLIAGLAGSVMTGTRGGWPALALAAVIMVRYSHALNSRRVRAWVIVSFVLVGATYFIPGSGVSERVDEGIAGISSYFNGGSVFTIMGIRLELWKSASMLIAEHPLLGIDYQAAAVRMTEWVAAGRLDPVVLTMPHLHNEYLQKWVTGGAVGLVIWLATLITPIIFFARQLAPGAQANKTVIACALAGLFVVTSYLCFGLTEVIFWSVKASLFYALMVFLLMGLCLNETPGVRS